MKDNTIVINHKENKKDIECAVVIDENDKFVGFCNFERSKEILNEYKKQFGIKCKLMKTNSIKGKY